jgi:RHS repeat-associated protein
MVEITPPGGAAIAMKYTDATQDRRIEVGDQRIAYNQLGLSAQAPTNASSDATLFVRDPNGRLVSMLSADAAKPDLYYVFDGLGSVVATTDGSGAVVRRYAYEPYGEEINPSATDRNPWRYAGGYFDKATGMLKFGARYYMPGVARWTQRDPVLGSLEDPRAINAYAYVGGDPINAVDSSGRFGVNFGNFDLSESLGAGFEGALSGAAVGFITGGPAGVLAGAGSGFVGGFFSTAAKQVGDKDIDALVDLYDMYGNLKTLKSFWKARDRISSF